MIINNKGICLRDEMKSNKHLIVTLCVLAFLIVGLSVGVIIFNLNKNKDDSCLGKTDDEEIVRCLSELNAKEDESTEETYTAALNKALDEKNYNLFEDILFDRAVDLALEKKCEKVYELVDNEEWMSRLPDDVKTTYYERAQDVAVECNDEDKFNYYGEKWDEIYWDTVYNNEEYYDEMTEEEEAEMNYEEEEEIENEE